MTRLRLTIDAIDENADGERLASLVADDGSGFVIPLTLLPEGVGRGDVLIVSIRRDADETKQRRNRIADLQRKLFG